LKIAIIATTLSGGGRVRALAYRNFLQSKNYAVDLLSLDKTWQPKMWFLYQRAYSHFIGRDPRLMNKIADKLEGIIKGAKYDVVIGVESPLSYVLTRDLGCLKLFSWEAMGADELYFEQCATNTVDLERIRCIRKLELEICKASDYVIFPWETTENYVRKHIWNGDNFVTIRYGCYPQSKPVPYSFPPSIVSVGCLKHHWAGKELLSELTRISPYAIDVYGKDKPETKYRLNYKGFADSLDVFYNYQFGLNTISKDVFRQNHFSSKPLSYIAYGLPVLSPDWMQFSHELRGCLPYNENNFTDLVDKYSEKDNWEKISKDAIEQARELDWAITLRPLEKIVAQGN
jgi:hypothetical protein